MAERKMTFLAAVHAGTLIDSLGKRVRWLDDESGDVLEGVARHIVISPDGAGFLSADDDIRDGYLRISGTFEHFIPVPDVLRMIGYMTYAEVD